MPGYVKPFWAEEGPGPLSLPVPGFSIAAGAINALAVDRFNADRVFVATVGGGIWTSNNAVSSRNPTWTPQSDFLPSLSMSTIAFDAADQSRNTLYAGCGGTSHSFPLVGANVGPLFGLLKTTDGATWTEIARAVFQYQSVWRILPTTIQTTLGNVVLVATSSGLFRSTDSGANWVMSNAINGQATDVVVDPGTETRIYVGAAGRLWRSEDGADTDWHDVTPAVWANLPSGSSIRFTVSPVADQQGKYWVYAASTGGSDGANNVVFSPDNGATWFPIGKAPDNSNPGGVFVASPLRPEVLFCATDAGSPDHYMVTVSTTQPTTWESVEFGGANGTGPHTDGRDVAITLNGDVLFECNDGGIYRLWNPHNLPKLQPRSWDEAVGNIRIAEFNSIAHDSINKILFGATQDNSIPQQTTPHGLDWLYNEKPWGDGFQVGVDVTSSLTTATHYSSQQNLGYMVRRTYTSPTNPSPDHWLNLIVAGTGGVEIHDFENNLKDDGGSSTVMWNNGFAVNAADGSRLLIGTAFLYESFDRGDTLTSLGGIAQSSKMRWVPTNPVGAVSAYAYGHRWNNDVIYVGGGGRLWVREGNAGPPSVVATYPGSTPFDIALDPVDWSRAYVVDDQGRVWRTRDAGATAKGWSELTGNLNQLSPDGALSTLSLRTIEIPPRFNTGGDEVIFVAGYGGVYVTENPGNGKFAFWQKHGANLPNAIITDIHYSSADDTLFAGSLGRAAWSLGNASCTIIGRPTVRLYASPRSASCFGGWVEGANIKFVPTILGSGSLVGPLSFRWTVQGGTTTSPLNAQKIVVTMPPAGTEISVTVTVTDATGYSMFAFFDDYTVTAQVAAWRSGLCELVGRLRSREIWHWPINPLGPDPGPEGIAERPNYAAIREIAAGLVAVTERLDRVDSGRIPSAIKQDRASPLAGARKKTEQGIRSTSGKGARSRR